MSDSTIDQQHVPTKREIISNIVEAHKLMEAENLRIWNGIFDMCKASPDTHTLVVNPVVMRELGPVPDQYKDVVRVSFFAPTTSIIAMIHCECFFNQHRGV